MDEETTLWEGGPAAAKDVPFYAVCFMLSPLVVPLFLAAWRFLETRSERYEVTTERIRVRRGVLNRRLEELELYRVRDTTLDAPLMLRAFGLANIEVISADASTPSLVLTAISEAEILRERLRDRVEKLRREKNVVAFEPY